jgi:hypothetical protein
MPTGPGREAFFVDDFASRRVQGTGWEKQMVEYPSVIREGDHLRLFYCGNSYGRTGIGTAVGTRR